MFKLYSTPLNSINSPSANRAGLGGVWTDSCFPSGYRSSPEVLAHIGNWLPSRSRAHEATTDALVLFELATTAKDRRADLVKAATQLIAIAAQHLRSAMQRPNADRVALLVIAQELLLCDIFNVYAADSRFWQHHIRGIIAMEALQTSELASSEFGRVLLRSTRLERLMSGVYLRRSMGAHMSLQSTAGLTPQLRHLERFLDIGLQIPPLLAAVDSASSITTQLLEVLHKALDIEKALQSWLADYESEMEITGEPYNYTPFGYGDLGYRMTAHEWPFTHILRFQSVLHANYHTVFWISLLLVSECIESVLKKLELSSTQSQSWPQTGLSAISASDMSTQADECALKLCQTIPYLYASCEGSTSKAMALSAPLYYSERRFAKTHPPRRQWCTEAREKLQQTAPFRNCEAAIIWHFFGLLWFNPAI